MTAPRRSRSDAPGFRIVIDPKDGWTRRRGRGRGRRGPPTASTIDRIDAKIALRDLTAAHELLQIAAGVTDADAQAHAHRTALDKIGLAARQLDEILIRRGSKLT